jgi:glycosyltransferase involved in cell wall biosynthesis
MKILCISHDISFTGAPKSLKTFVEWASHNNPDIQFDLILKSGIEHPTQFKSAYSFYPQKFVRSKKILNRLAHIFGLLNLALKIHRYFLFLKLKKNNYDIIYSNTIVNDDVLKFLAKIKCKKIVHVRELQSTIDDFGGDAIIKIHTKIIDKYIAITHAVANNLIENGIPKEKITVLNNHIKIKEPKPLVTKRIKESYNIPANAFVIGGCGTFIWRKGFDVFLTMASSLKAYNDIYFVWYGRISEQDKRRVDYDLKRLNLQNRFVFDTFPPEESIDYFSIMSVFVLTSKEEPFGLVGLEAAYNKAPVICFKNAGGQEEFVSKGAGFVIPYLDIEMLKEKLLELRKNENLRKAIGTEAKQIVSDNYDINKVAPKLLKLICND